MLSLGFKEWSVGDVVRIVDAPYMECPFAWVDTMDKYCSMEAKICKKRLSEQYNTYQYIIDIDDGDHYWCGNCFEEVYKEEEATFEVSEDDFKKLIFV